MRYSALGYMRRSERLDMTVRIVTDSGCDVPPHVAAELQEAGVVSVPILFRFGREQWIDRNMPMSEFLARAALTSPQTAAPSPGDFAAAFRPWVAAGDQVVCIALTAKHSGTYESAVVASRQFAPGQVTVVDSQSLSVGEGALVAAAARAARQGASVADIVALISDLQRRLHLFITLDTVDFLVRGGRASRLTGIMAGLLKIRPMLTMPGGELTLIGRPRGRQQAKQELLKLAQSHFPAELVWVGHIACAEEGDALADELTRLTGYPRQDLAPVETGMVLAAHGGPGTLGILVISK